MFSNNMNNQWLRGFTASLLIFALTGCAELAYLLDNADQSAGLALGTDGLYAGYSAGYAGSYYGSSAIDPFYGSNTTYCYLGPYAYYGGVYDPYDWTVSSISTGIQPGGGFYVDNFAEPIPASPSDDDPVTGTPINGDVVPAAIPVGQPTPAARVPLPKASRTRGEPLAPSRSTPSSTGATVAPTPSPPRVTRPTRSSPPPRQTHRNAKN